MEKHQRLTRIVLAAMVGLGLACANPEVTANAYMKDLHKATEQVMTPDMPCDAPVPTTRPKGCLSGVLHCGDEIEGNTDGGDSLWDDTFYAKKFCFPAGNGHPGPERIYQFDMPEYTQVTIKLQTDCTDLDLVAVSWAYEGSCPDERHAVFACEGSNKRGWDELLIQNFQARSYLIGVDGKGYETGTFRLKVQCDTILRPEERQKF